MNGISVSSLLEDLRKIRDYSSMADVSHDNIGLLFSKQLRSLPLRRGDKNVRRGYLCGRG